LNGTEGAPPFATSGSSNQPLPCPRAGFGGQFLHADLFEMAAAYVFHIVQNHPFVDGNKRVGAMAAFTFLKLNRLILTAPDTNFEDVILRVAQGERLKADVAEFFRKHTRGSL
jgi:death-on-curing protein